ncbi:MAG: hypothetical protein WDM90_14070 [Ferruginibacter sp.]
MKYLILIALSAIVFFNACKSSKHKLSKAAENLSYTIEAPGGWEIADTFLMGQTIIFMRMPLENADDHFLENATVTTYPNDSTDDAFIDNTIVNEKNGLIHFEEKSVSNEHIGVMDFKALEYSHIFGGTPVDVKEYFYFGKDSVYLITLSAEAGKFPKFKPQFDEIIGSFKLKKK